jgi:hypothetical protein
MDYSPRFIWNLVRRDTHELNDNVGVDYRVALKMIADTGLATEADFPFATAEQQGVPKLFAALFSEVPNAAGVQTVGSAEAMKQSLAKGMPVVFGIMAYESTMHTNGVIPVPKAGEQELGGHILLAVGYDEARQHFIVRNSWGTAWGDHGYGYLPYAFVRTGKVHIGATAKI